MAPRRSVRTAGRHHPSAHAAGPRDDRRARSRPGRLLLHRSSGGELAGGAAAAALRGRALRRSRPGGGHLGEPARARGTAGATRGDAPERRARGRFPARSHRRHRPCRAGGAGAAGDRIPRQRARRHRPRARGARRRPRTRPQLRLIGPRFVGVRELAARPNVRLIEAVPHRDVMRYMAHFDVGILPYVLDAFTAAVMPVKLKEYLAAGLPVVSTPLPDVLRFAQHHQEMVAFADNGEDFVAALRAAVASNTPDAVARRIEVARGYDWKNQMETLGGWMEDLMATPSYDPPR